MLLYGKADIAVYIGKGRIEFIPTRNDRDKARALLAGSPILPDLVRGKTFNAIAGMTVSLANSLKLLVKSRLYLEISTDRD